MTQGSSSTEVVFEDLYEDAPCGLLSVLPSGEIVRVNRTLLSWTGYSADEIHGGKRFTALLTPPGALLYESYCVPLLRTRGSLAEIALDLLCSDGARMPVLFSAVARKDASGGLCLFRVVILNAPKRREYERELLLARTQAEEAAEELNILRTIAELKVVEQDDLLQAMGRMAAGDLETPILIEPESGLVTLARGLDRMREDILGQVRDMKERNAEISRLNAELLHQIEQRSRVLFESMQSSINNSVPPADDGSGQVLPILPSGTVLAKRYRVEAILGRGAMGTVYEVERTSDGRRFAAKVLRAKPDYRAMARFAREALLLARLQHPNLIAIVDLDITTDRVACLIMELVKGQSLAELSARYGDRDFMLPVLHQIADALTTVHSAGVVHRDLKPANVLVSVSADGMRATARLADFGISRLLNLDQGAPDSTAPPQGGSRVEPLWAGSSGLDTTIGELAQAAVVSAVLAVPAGNACDPTLEVRAQPAAVARVVDGPLEAPWAPPSTSSDGGNSRKSPSDTLTQAGALVGTLLYMAPELLGGANLAQPPSDIFSFGVMAYEVLTGTLPFDEPPLVMAARSRGLLRVKPLDTMCPGLAPALARLLERCLSLDPEARPTAIKLSDALGTIQIPR
ncbi:MAG: protein kinase domain-containing protein [Byssovorax sp.]